MARRQLRQVVDLYTRGKVVVLRDGSPVWVQALNPFEQDTARNEAQIAKARITFALKEHDSDEQAKVRMFFFEEGPDAARSKIIDAKVAEAFPKILDKLRYDPEWRERLDILDRGLENLATPPEQAEEDLLTKLAEEYDAEVKRRLHEEKEFQTEKYESASDDFIWDEYLEWYLDRRAAEIMMAEFRLHQLLFGVRWCSATVEDGLEWDHALCGGHTDRVFVSKEDIHGAPEELCGIFMDAFDEIEMSVREAKNSDRQGSSSDSSPLPSEVEESTASTPTETRVTPPGSSSSPSDTP